MAPPDHPLPLVEMFHSIQGEGTWAGTNAFFIRLAGCDVGCPWCDTKESWNAKRHPQCEVTEILAAVSAAQPRIVVITGGEPLMHDLQCLTKALKAQRLQVHLETSGAYPLRGRFDWITLSPKHNKPPHPSLYAHAHELKVVVVHPGDLIWAEQQAAKLPPTIPKFLQPEWGTPTAKSLIFDYVLQHPEWRISLQTHKFLEIR